MKRYKQKTIQIPIEIQSDQQGEVYLVYYIGGDEGGGNDVELEGPKAGEKDTHIPALS